MFFLHQPVDTANISQQVSVLHKIYFKFFVFSTLIITI